MAYRFMIGRDVTIDDGAPRLAIIKMPLWLALASDWGPEWLCGIVGHRFCNNKLWRYIDTAYETHPKFEIPLGDDATSKKLQEFLGWPVWDEDESEDDDEPCSPTSA